VIRHVYARELAARAAASLYDSRDLLDYRGNAASETAVRFQRKTGSSARHTFELAKSYALVLQAWAFFANHYHIVMSFENTAMTHRDFMRHLHRELAIRLNRIDATPGRRVMYEFWDTRLTFEKPRKHSGLNYVHQNAVKHGLVPLANQYPWCSASWFESNARPGFAKSVYSFKTDRIKVPDDF
jgi:putative transposase